MRCFTPLLALVLTSSILSGCTTQRARRPAVISHIVLVSLNDSADVAAFIEDCDRLLPTIPSVTSYACGEHVDAGRGSVAQDYDVGIYVGFDDIAGYIEYVEHPSHVELVQSWRPRIRTLVSRDVLDETP